MAHLMQTQTAHRGAMIIIDEYDDGPREYRVRWSAHTPPEWWRAKGAVGAVGCGLVRDYQVADVHARTYIDAILRMQEQDGLTIS